jgi:hypothetical protein
MPTSRGEWFLFFVGSAVIASLIVLNVAAWQDYTGSEQATTPRTGPVSGGAASTEGGAPFTGGSTTPESSTGTTRATRRQDTENPTPPGTPRLADLRVTAATGDCWLEIRVGSATGTVLHSGVLAQGQTLHFRRRALWIRAGAPLYLALTLNGKPAEDFPLTTADALVTARGVETLSLG